MENLKNKGNEKMEKQKRQKMKKEEKNKSQIQCFLEEEHMFFLERDN